MRPEDDDVLLLDMVVAAREALSLTTGMAFEDFEQQRVVRLAIERLVQIIGEAGSRLTPETRARLPALPWRDIIGLRHRLVHGYRDIRSERLWDVIESDLEELIAAIEPLLPSDDASARRTDRPVTERSETTPPEQMLRRRFFV